MQNYYFQLYPAIPNNFCDNCITRCIGSTTKSFLFYLYHITTINRTFLQNLKIFKYNFK